MTTSDRFRKIREEADRLHFDDSVVEVDAPLEDCEDGWGVGFGAETEMPLAVTGSTLDEALDGLIAALAELRFTAGDVP